MIQEGTGNNDKVDVDDASKTSPEPKVFSPSKSDWFSTKIKTPFER
jgi:hypothetical protein